MTIRKSIHKIVPLLAGSLFLFSQSLAAATGAAFPPLQLPNVSAPIAVTATSRPFLGAPAAMAAAGYVEEEYFLSGAAHVYDWANPEHKAQVVAGPGKYTTRILVRRPRDPAKFSGNVELTILNASLNADFGGPSDWTQMAAQGDVWIGITSKPVTAKALQQFDPARYAALDWSNPTAPEHRCSQPTIIPVEMIGGDSALWSKTVMWLMATTGIAPSKPETEDGLIWDMLGQLGLLLKSEQRSAILPGFSKPWVYMTGVSQSAIYIRTWAKAFHDRYRTPDGKPVYDGYLAIVGPALARINQCAADVPLVDPAQKLAPLDVPFISLSSEGEMWQARTTHQPDVFTPAGGIVSYEVAGASHMAGEIPGVAPDALAFASPADMAQAGVKPPGSRSDNNYDFAWAPVIRGAFHNLQLWVRQGIRPPQAPGIEITEKQEVKRDSYGNALGGVRMPYIEVPVAQHIGFQSAGGLGGIKGTRQPFSPEALKKLYPDHATYVAKFSAATDRFANERWVSPEDAAAMKKAANSARVPE